MPTYKRWRWDRWGPGSVLGCTSIPSFRSSSLTCCIRNSSIFPLICSCLSSSTSLISRSRASLSLSHSASLFCHCRDASSRNNMSSSASLAFSSFSCSLTTYKTNSKQNNFWQPQNQRNVFHPQGISSCSLLSSCCQLLFLLLFCCQVRENLQVQFLTNKSCKCDWVGETGWRHETNQFLLYLSWSTLHLCLVLPCQNSPITKQNITCRGCTWTWCTSSTPAPVYAWIPACIVLVGCPTSQSLSIYIALVIQCNACTQLLMKFKPNSSNSRGGLENVLHSLNWLQQMCPNIIQMLNGQPQI